MEDPIDDLAQREYGSISSSHDGHLIKVESVQGLDRNVRGFRRKTHGCDEDEERFEYLDLLSEEVQTQIDEDEVFRELGQDSKHIFCRSLRPFRHGVIGIVLEGDPTEEKRYNA